MLEPNYYQGAWARAWYPGPMLGVLPSTYMGSVYHAQAQRVWVYTTCLDLFFTSNRLRHLALA
jgi:hypothetical protein